MYKVSIIGAAGTLGAAIAYDLASNIEITEICLLDVNEKLLLNHLLDLQNAFPNKDIYSGSYENLKNSDVVVITAGIPNRNDVSSRNEFLEGNLKLFKEFGKKLSIHAPDSIIITASNPVDILNYYLYKEFGFSRHKLIGYTMNDSLRFEWAIRKVMKLTPTDYVFSPVIGEHGSSQVPLFSQVVINKFSSTVPYDIKEKILNELNGWFHKFNKLSINRTTGWTTARGMGQVINKLLSLQSSTIIGSAILNGEYGVSNVSLGVPLTISNKGILSIDEWEISKDERGKFEKSAKFVDDTIEVYLNRVT
ncbi:malate dehydrogenase [Alkalihalophilus pseudofirmus OF4]|uniref:Malate dehydrogenase n=2 Tax=Alkalihalophilus pseudofirmus TaxID=79885 RepID=D3FWQ5_ALKPO|nr:malate dehydrogenase [Alkalihalophilus pseudofirmus]ADC50553.1 malate dehydrogenase [Alkalihalophilus pseudofirmus OF4]MDV2883702.1 hypothetical protein [Alkalihalophilus pseudofirmus]